MMELQEFKKTPFYQNYRHFIKTMGWKEFKERYPGIVKSAELWLYLENLKRKLEVDI